MNCKVLGSKEESTKSLATTAL